VPYSSSKYGVTNKHHLLGGLGSIENPETNPTPLVLLDNTEIRNYQIMKSEDLHIPQDIKALGQGYFGEVRLGYWRNTRVACKKIYEKTFLNKSDQHLFFREVSILSQLIHPNIVQFLGVCVDKADNIIVTEFMEGGSLNDKLRKSGFRLDYTTLLKITIQMALGMNHLHMEGVFHRDLTSRNILLTQSMDAKVADFGLSKKTSINSSGSFTMGSLAWMAPEVLTNPKKFTYASDVYSYGIILWELFTNGKNPCPSGLTDVTLANKVINEAWRPSLPPSCPFEWVNLIESCWSQDPVRRPSFNTIIGILQKWAMNPHIINEDSGDSSEMNSDSQNSSEEEEVFASDILSHTTSQFNPYDDHIVS